MIRGRSAEGVETELLEDISPMILPTSSVLDPLAGRNIVSAMMRSSLTDFIIFSLCVCVSYIP